MAKKRNNRNSSFRNLSCPVSPTSKPGCCSRKWRRTSSFTRAADELGLSKATVSRAIARLEARIGTSLLNRTSRSLSLTEAGRHMAMSAARILAEGETLEAEAIAQAVAPHGLVRLTAPMSFGLARVAPILPELFQTYPDVSITCIWPMRWSIWWLAVSTSPCGSPHCRTDAAGTPHLPNTPFARGHAAYFQRRGRPLHPGDLAHHACLGYAYLPTQDRWRFIHMTGEEVSVTPRSQLRANNADALQPMLLAGMGLAVQPEFLISEDLEAGRLEIAMSDWSMPPIALNIVTPPGNFRPACVTAVIEFLLRRFADAPWARAEGP